ncbi:MAG: DUF2752 domain-containing protein [Armatimonadetes bacterium]|nr:DUF2752 domain-containing protein [Armatimonadota bacterium]
MVLFDAGWPKKKLSGQAVWFGVWLVVTLVAALLHPSRNHHGTHTQLGLPPCPSVFLFHRPCPGCGLTTSWTATVHGDLPTAFQAHPLGPVLYGVFTAMAWLSLIGYLKGLRLRSESRPATVLLTTIFFAVLGFGVFRFATVRYEEPGVTVFDLFDRPAAGQDRGQAARVPEQRPAVNVAPGG